MLGVVYGIVRGNDAGWDSLEVMGSIGLGAVLLVAFVLWERRTPAPLLPLRLFRDRSFSVANVVGLVFSFGIFGSIFILIQFMQIVQGLSPLEAGVRTMPWTMAPMVIAPLAGFIAPRVGTRVLIVVGLAMQAIAMFWLGATLSADVEYLEMLTPFILAGVGMGLVFAPMSTAVLATMRTDDHAKASGTNATLREVGVALGIAVLTAVFVGLGWRADPDRLRGCRRPRRPRRWRRAGRGRPARAAPARRQVRGSGAPQLASNACGSASSGQEPSVAPLPRCWRAAGTRSR